MLIAAIILLSVAFALSPQEFQTFYEPHNTKKHQTFGSRFPIPHFVQPPADNSLGFNRPNREPQTTRNPYKVPNDFNKQRPSINQTPYRPLRPFTSAHKPALQNEMNLVKLRKMYSHIKDTNKSPSEYHPNKSPSEYHPNKSPSEYHPNKSPSEYHSNNRFTIPLEYIRNNYGYRPNRFKEQSIRRPVWGPYRQKRGMKEKNTVDRYLGSNNKSIIYETTLQAAVEVEKSQNKFDTDYEGPLDLQNELEETTFSSRPKRFIINEELLRAFYMQIHIKSCTTANGLDGRCADYLYCYKTRGSPEFSKQCGFEACCVYSVKTCGRTSTKNNTIWLKPEEEYGDSCRLKIAKLSQGICQIKLDFKELKLQGPTNGTCLADKLVVSGQNINSIMPVLCGEVTGDHMYVDVDYETGPIELNIVSVGNFDRRWNIKISQIECSNLNRPPRNCLQYYTNTSGIFGSFNRNNTAREYLNNLNYAICLRKAAGYCSIQYDLTQEGIFNFTNIGNASIPTVAAGNAGVGAVDCPDDYIVIAGNRLCGDRFNDGSNPSMTENTKVTDSTNGPFIIQVNSNEVRVSEGFQLNYFQIPCL